ncbi:MAG: hypothetical protein ACYC8S_02090 [Minisyncoccota bacterium]
MNKQTILLVVSTLVILGAGLFFFFYAPNQSCILSRNQSGEPVQMCPEPKQSPYQKILLKMHAYFYPNDTCIVNVETGEADCRPFLLPPCDQSATTTPCGVLENMKLPPLQTPVATGTPVSEWETFENTGYGYSVLVPRTAFIRGIVVPADIHKASELAFSAEGGDFSIVVGGLAMAKDKETFERQKELTAFDLKTYAKIIRDSEINFSNQSISNRKIGGLEEIQFAGTKAYRFILDKPFWGLYDGGENMKSAHWYLVVTENLRGQKVVIGYPINPASEKMVRLIRFTK